ncbi:hypothetical protein Ddc_17546 [Ditylenchus destructor]|nr:hypothetical protein Ddc_17546 [Ditylenchus destructor]
MQEGNRTTFNLSMTVLDGRTFNFTLRKSEERSTLFYTNDELSNNFTTVYYDGTEQNNSSVTIEASATRWPDNGDLYATIRIDQKPTYTIYRADVHQYMTKSEKQGYIDRNLTLPYVVQYYKDYGRTISTESDLESYMPTFVLDFFELLKPELHIDLSHDVVDPDGSNSKTTK